MKDIKRAPTKDTHHAGMGGKAVPPEEQWRPRGEERYAGPKDSTRGPRSARPVAVVGASVDRTKFGNKAVRAYAGDGYTVWPVNPKGGAIEGLDSYRRLTDLPGLPFIASIYLHEDEALAVLDEIADLQRSAGDSVAVVYLNPGSDTAEVVDRARELGLFTLQECSIRAIGHDPDEYV